MPRDDDDAGDPRRAQVDVRAAGGVAGLRRGSGGESLRSRARAVRVVHQRLKGKAAAVERSAHEATLSALDVDAPKILINGEVYTRVGRHETTFMTQPGPLSDVLAILRKRRELSVTLLCDGAPEMWNLVDEQFDAKTFAGFSLHRLIDYWHAIENLSARPTCSSRRTRPRASSRAGKLGAQSQRRPRRHPS